MKRKILTGGGAAHFVTFGTYGRRSLLASPRARQVVISQLGKIAAQGEAKVSGFVIMPDHVHALLWFNDDSVLPEMLDQWKSESSRLLRNLYEDLSPEMIDHLHVTRSGRESIAFWQRRYYDFNVFTKKKLSEKLDYMHYNPVKKGLCATPEDWLWGSARWYLLGKSVGVKIESGF